MKLASCLFGFLAVAGLTATLSAQPAGPRPSPIKSPVVHADRTVTFNFRSPTATKVELSGQFQKANQPPMKDDAGVWSITVGPNPEATNGQVKLLWLGVGRSDFLYPQATAFVELPKQRKLVHQSLITEAATHG